jgi:proteasome lid subunit RPN8/RPN11
MTPFPPIERWRVPETACELTCNAVTPAGLAGCESGVFWLGRRDAVSEVTAVAFPVGEGVEETPFYWSVAPEVYAAITAWAKPRGLSLLAVAHTHLSSRPPRLSATDRRNGLKTPEALAVIVPNGGEEADPGHWGWFVYENADYRTLDEAERAARLEFVRSEAEFVVIGDEEAA